MSELHEQRDRAVSFGSIAEVYDRARPSYPDALVRDLLVADPHDVLDVGCGTGKAGRLFAAQGCTVLGVEPDAAMAEVARSHGLTVEVAGFEAWDAAGRDFDLLISGQAWHWVDPDAGARAALAVLRPGGAVALFWNTDTLAGGGREALDAAYEGIAPQLMHRNRSFGGKQGPRTPVVQGLEDAGFADVTERRYPWTRHYEPDAYLALVSTFSDHNLLPADDHARLFAALRETVEASGGVDIAWETQLISAVRS